MTTADSIRAEYERKLAHIRGRRDLNDQAQRVAIARAYSEAEQKMEQLRQADTERFQRDRARLERQLFGAADTIGSDAVNQRQAREMAAQLTDPQQAADAYQRAKRDGDTAYARAIASHAADLSTVPVLGLAWQPIVDQYTQDSPARADAYKQLADMHQPGHGTDFTYVLPTPSEMGRLSAGQVMALADTDLEVHGDAPTAA
ncbi:hypothetical protein ACFXGG_33500 [Streptomyces nigra]|uniref:hypothetical protein n=1 Tax=Streptomyces nigra TaxID=1827580 RepID=UPI0036C57554